MISVIIPFYNSASTLPFLLNALSVQTYPFCNFEVILVDNNSNDLGRDVINRFLIKEPKINIRYLKYTDKLSSYAARNFGVKNSRGDILAFTDADCIPGKEWLNEIATFFLTSKNQILAGFVNLVILDRNNIWEAFDKSAHMNNEIKAKRACVATANMAVRQKDFMRAGNFLEVTSGADYAWSQRAAASGYNIQFNSLAIVFHPTRKTKNEIAKKLFRIASGQAELASKKGRSRVISTLAYAFRTLFPIRLIRYSYGVFKYAGFFLALSFLFQITLLSFKQVLVFFKIYKCDL